MAVRKGKQKARDQAHGDRRERSPRERLRAQTGDIVVRYARIARLPNSNRGDVAKCGKSDKAIFDTAAKAQAAADMINLLPGIETQYVYRCQVGGDVHHHLTSRRQ